MTNTTTIESLAVEMNVTVSDVAAFVDCLRVWISKGHSIEQAITKHMEQMTRLANQACHPAMREIVVDSYDELRGKV